LVEVEGEAANVNSIIEKHANGKVDIEKFG